MLSRLLLLAFLFLTGGLHAADDKDLPPDEFAVKRFLVALAAKDEKALRDICLFHDSLDCLWAGSPPSPEKLAATIAAIRKEPVKWLAPGDSFRVSGAELVVRDTMITDKKRIATLRLHDFSFPIFARLTPRGEWKIDPSFIVTLTLDRLRKEEKANRKNFTLLIDGKETPFNLGENLELTLADGRKVKAQVVQNLFQHHEDADLRLSWPRELDLRLSRDPSCTVYTLKGALSAHFMVHVYPKGKLDEIRRDITAAFVENNRADGWILDKDVFRDSKIEAAGGAVLAGKRIAATKNPQQKLPEKIEELYFWETGDGRVLCLYGTWAYQDSAACRDWFATLAKGIEIKAKTVAPSDKKP
ncbi:MAG: hypothetical protein RL095_3158 [Verrucomicrobiota bacterium]|jgi:hypothetical protein